MESSRQEYWHGLPFPPPGDLPNPGNEPTSPVSPALVGRFFSTEPPAKLSTTVLRYLVKQQSRCPCEDIFQMRLAFKASEHLMKHFTLCNMGGTHPIS